MTKDKYMNHYTSEAKLGKAGKIKQMLKMISKDLSYRRKNSMLNSYKLACQYSTSNDDKYCHRGLVNGMSSFTIMSVNDLSYFIKHVRIPYIKSRKAQLNIGEQAKKYLNIQLTKIFSSKKIDSLVQRADIEDRLDSVEWTLKDIVNNNLGYKNDQTNYDKQLKVLKHAYRVLQEMPDKNTILKLDGRWLKPVTFKSKKSIYQFYHGLSKSKIKEFYNQYHFQYKNQVHFAPAMPYQVNDNIKFRLHFMF